ncbi:Vacuolar sorting protein 39 domain 2, putative [Hepatocystis sp. ex Piliocolobus tephrosceles]|nr:Vacuolar sorting protein 39 domain 2, putative [Hepatocystis sp. ex Piliocolobus tephrosceles]
MNLQIYHNLIKSTYLNYSYQLIKEKEKKIIINDNITCIICNNIILERQFACFPNNNMVHIHCLDKYDKEE